MSEYARAGVNYKKIEPFKREMIRVGKETLTFSNLRGVYINTNVLHTHGAVYEFRRNPDDPPDDQPMWCKTQEGLGNKNWIAEWMYQNAGTGKTYYEGIGMDTALMAVNDCIAQGAMPVVYTDEVAAGDSEWYEDEQRAQDLAKGYFEACKLVGMALPAGESSSLRYLVKSEMPVRSAPVLSGCVTGIIHPRTNLITGANLSVGDSIIGVTSSGMHANGVSLVIKRALLLPDKFLTKLPNGKTLGVEALIPTRSYVALIEALLKEEVPIHALLPGTGDGVGKIAFDDRPYSYRIHNWVPVPPLIHYMRELGVSIEDCLKTFNWGIGYYIFVDPRDVDRVVSIGREVGYDPTLVGRVEEGERRVIFEPEGITLPPPGQ